MKRLIQPIILIILTAVLPLGCQTDTVPPLKDVTYASKLSPEPVLVQTFSVGAASDEATKEAIIKAATVRGWDVTDLGDNRIQAVLVHRASDSTLTFEYGNSTVRIYSVSYKIDKESQVRIKREEPAGWIRNLHKDILDLLGLLPRS